MAAPAAAKSETVPRADLYEVKDKLTAANHRINQLHKFLAKERAGYATHVPIDDVLRVLGAL